MTRRPTAPVLAGLIACALVLGACSGTPEADVAPLADDTPTLTPTPTPTPTPDPTPDPDPLAIPDDPAAIDEAYLLGVLNALFAAETDRTRHMLTTRQRDDEWQAWLDALYAPEGHDFQQRFFEALEQSWDIFRPIEEFEVLTVAEVTRIVSAGPDCVFVEAPYRRGAILPGEPEWQSIYAGLRPHQGQADPARNPTPWWFVQWVHAGETEPDNPCL